MGAYSDYPNHIYIVDPKEFNQYLNMIAAEKELEEKTLLDLLNEVEEEQHETKLSDNIFVYNANIKESKECPNPEVPCDLCGAFNSLSCPKETEEEFFDNEDEARKKEDYEKEQEGDET